LHYAGGRIRSVGQVTACLVAMRYLKLASSVDMNGLVTSAGDSPLGDPIGERTHELEGRRCIAHTTRSAGTWSGTTPTWNQLRRPRSRPTRVATRPGSRPFRRRCGDLAGGAAGCLAGRDRGGRPGPSAPQNARRRRQERRDSYLPGEPTLEREQPVSSCLCFR
jgi:hypothetical protein